MDRFFWFRAPDNSSYAGAEHTRAAVARVRPHLPCTNAEEEHLRPAIADEGDLEVVLTDSHLGSFVWMPAGECLAPEDTVRTLAQAGVSGLRARRVTVQGVRGGRGGSPPRLWQLIVVGSAGHAGHNSGVRLLRRCSTCRMAVYSRPRNAGHLIDPEQWDGRDFCTVHPLRAYALVSAHASEVLVQQRLTNYELASLDQIVEELSWGNLTARAPEWLEEQVRHSLTLAEAACFPDQETARPSIASERLESRLSGESYQGWTPATIDEWLGATQGRYLPNLSALIQDADGQHWFGGERALPPQAQEFADTEPADIPELVLRRWPAQPRIELPELDSLFGETLSGAVASACVFTAPGAYPCYVVQRANPTTGQSAFLTFTPALGVTPAPEGPEAVRWLSERFAQFKGTALHMNEGLISLAQAPAAREEWQEWYEAGIVEGLPNFEEYLPLYHNGYGDIVLWDGDAVRYFRHDDRRLLGCETTDIVSFYHRLIGRVYLGSHEYLTCDDC